MQRFFGGAVFELSPPGMWPYDRASKSGPIVHVLNGDYPEADLRRMSLPRLERLVSSLVQCTAEAVGAKTASKPKWWPSGLVFTHPIDLGLSSEREIKLAFKQLIVNCCQFFKRHALVENRGKKRPRQHQLPPPKRHKPPPDSPSKTQFLAYFRLNAKRDQPCERPEAPTPAGAAKLTACINIPFSSDVGRLMAAREHHRITDDLKLKRLERSEWYTNKGAPRAAEVEYEACTYKEPPHSHTYRMPKRQHHHKRRSLHDADFLARFCTPLTVNLPRLDLDKVRSDKRRELVVLIRDTEKMCCDLHTDKDTASSSP
jgi:hypothetical protein